MFLLKLYCRGVLIVCFPLNSKVQLVLELKVVLPVLYLPFDFDIRLLYFVVVVMELLLLFKTTEGYFQIPVFSCRNTVPPKSRVLVVKVNSVIAECAQQVRYPRLLGWDSGTRVGQQDTGLCWEWGGHTGNRVYKTQRDKKGTENRGDCLQSLAI